MNESTIVTTTLIALNRLQTCYAWRNNTGVASIRGRRVAFGDLGSPDILGCYRGLFFGVECKAARGAQSPVQARWQRTIEAAGGVYILARLPTEAVDLLTTAVKGRGFGLADLPRKY